MAAHHWVASCGILTLSSHFLLLIIRAVIIITIVIPGVSTQLPDQL
jgi:hypothetical protein